MQPDTHFPHDTPASYQCWVRLTGRLALQSLGIELDLQMAPLSLPALDLGDNTVEYEDQTEGSRCVEITHQWLERDDNPSPAAAARRRLLLQVVAIPDIILQ